MRSIVRGALALASLCCAAQEREAWREMNRPIEPFRIIGNVYYVGASDVTSFLITTPAGHILIDGGFDETVPLIRDSIDALGFELADVRILLNSHAHLDHAGGLAGLKELSGAKLYASAADAPLLERGGRGDPILGDSATYPAVSVDHRLKDGEIVELGGTRLTAHVTAGHTPGCTSWSFEVEEQGARHLAVSICSLSILDGMRFVERPTWPGAGADFESSLVRLRSLPAEVFLAAHGSFFRMRDKRAAQRGGAAPNPFIDPEGYRAYLDRAEASYRAALASELPEPVRVAPLGEPGQPLLLEGTVRDGQGRPVAGAKVTVFHTDARGYYTPEDERTGRMDEPNARLKATFTTGPNGRYAFATIRPGGYPVPRTDVSESDPMRLIPAHVHYEVTAAGFADRRFQLVFDDDPRMNAAWRRWAAEGGHSISSGSCDITLEPR
jgi:metallo-beta-lactamase class B